jgi:hypothetical protein
MGFCSKMLWGIGYGRVMGYGCEIPANQVGNSKILWGMREYGVSGVWVKRVTTVVLYDNLLRK